MQVIDDGIEVSELIEVLKNSIKRASYQGAFDGPGALEVVSAQLTLSIAAVHSRGGGVHFRVAVIGTEISFGSKQERRQTHTLNLTLTPTKESGPELRDGEIEHVLVDAIVTVYSPMERAGSGDQPWALESGVIDIVFAVSETGSITLGIDADRTGEITHAMRLSMRPSSPANHSWALTETSFAAGFP